jgi:hypothetical protein
LRAATASESKGQSQAQPLLPTKARDVQESPCQQGAVHTWHIADINRHLLFGRYWPASRNDHCPALISELI